MQTGSWNIRRGTAADADVLIEFNISLALETESKQLPQDIVSRGVARGLEQGDEVAYYVAESDRFAESDREILGSLMLTREWSDWRDGWIVWIQSVYVREAHRGKGVFKSLLESVIELLRDAPDVIGIRLYVEVENSRAQEVYTRCGFGDPNYKVMEMML